MNQISPETVTAWYQRNSDANLPSAGRGSHVAQVPSSGEAMSLPEGTLIAERYELGKVLGVGGFAIVYSARDKRL